LIGIKFTATRTLLVEHPFGDHRCQYPVLRAINDNKRKKYADECVVLK
jgi:hypothetical protein